MNSEKNVPANVPRRETNRQRLLAFFGIRAASKAKRTDRSNGVSTGLWISTALAFVATFGGVLLAQRLSDSARARAEYSSYQTLISMMATDCERNAALNAQVDPGSEDRNLRPTVFLFSAALQNALLFSYMEPQTLSALIESMTQTNQSMTLYTAFMNTPRFAYAVPHGPQDEPRPGEDRYAYQARMFRKGQAETRASAMPILKQLGAEQAKLCALLRAEEKRALAMD